MVRYRISAIIAISVLLASLLTISLPTPALASTTTFHPEKDNYINHDDPTWNRGSQTTLAVGAYGGGTDVMRSLVEFSIEWGVDIPAGATITSASLKLYYKSHGGAADPVGRTCYAQRLRRLDWTETGSTWNNYKSGSAWTTAGAGSSVSDYTTSGQASATVPASIDTWMSWDVLTQIQYAQTNDVNPAFRIVDSSEVQEYKTNFSSEEGDHAPALVITYTYAGSPLMITGSASSITSSSAICAGTVSDTGDATVTRRGIQYGLSQTPTWDNYETGSFGNGPYSRTLTDLSPYTLYYYRAYAVNTYGTGYGSWSSFTTSMGVPSVATGSATSVLNTTATLGATVTSTGGGTITTRGIQYGLTQTPTWDSHEDGSFGTGEYSRDVTGLDPGTDYWFRGYATNAAGTGYGSWVSFTTMDLPSVITKDASNVAATSARLNSALASDGEGDCTIEFGWGLTSESAIDDYDSHETVAGTYNTGAYPYLDVDGLLSGYTYYFRVSATNDVGTNLGGELTFETPITLDAPINFVGYPEPMSISLSWSKGTGSSNTLVRYNPTTYPTTITAGTYAYFGPSTTYTLDELLAGTTYYFSAWGESGGNYSTSYATLLMTTSASAGTGTSDIDVPGQPSRWFSAPDYTSMAGLGLLYEGYNAALDTAHIPRETGWFLSALGFAFLAGLIVYLKLGKKLMIGMIALTVVLAMGYFARLIPWWVPLMSLILVIAFSQTHKQVEQG